MPLSALASRALAPRGCTLKNLSPVHGTSRCRFSVTERELSWRSENATVPRSAATKKSWKRRRLRVSRTRSARSFLKWQRGWGETPAPGCTDAVGTKLFEMAARLGAAVAYQSAGTVEFIFDNGTADVYFLEVNTRLQVEHGVTEEVTGIDLVAWMIRQAAGEMPSLADIEIHPAGCSLEVRIYAEDPAKNFQPSAGRLTTVKWPEGARVETWVESGSEVTPYYDPMLAKIIVRAEDRAGAIVKLRAALAEARVSGIETNLAYLREVVADPEFAAGGISTGFLEGFRYSQRAVEVIEPGTQTTVQDYP